MASEQTEPKTDPQPQPIRPMSRRRKRKLVIVSFVIIAAAVFVLWGWSSTGGSFVSVASVTSDPGHYAGRTIEVQGVVSGWSGDPSDMDFELVDSDNSACHVSVVMSGALPAGFENGKSVVVKGSVDTMPMMRIVASEITVGCASKY